MNGVKGFSVTASCPGLARPRGRSTWPLLCRNALYRRHQRHARLQRLAMRRHGLCDEFLDRGLPQLSRGTQSNAPDLAAGTLQQAFRIVESDTRKEEQSDPIGVTRHRQECVGCTLGCGEGEDQCVVVVIDEFMPARKQLPKVRPRRAKLGVQRGRILRQEPGDLRVDRSRLLSRASR